MAVELASAYLSLIPTLRGATKQIQSELSGIDVKAPGTKLGAQLSGSIGAAMNFKTIGAKFSEMGGQISGVGTKLTKGITVPIAGATTAAAGLVGVLGFKRLVGIDTARGQFKGLGYDADEVMKQVDKGVTGTALSMADGASMAVGILATGAVPMKDLEDQIQRTANVSAAYGVEGSHAANLLNAVLTKNKVTYGDLSQMQANGIPIISQLADNYGVAGDEIEKMARDGKISIEDMNKVIDQNAGAAAEEYSKTWAGVTANIKSNIGKLGAEILGGVFPQMQAQAEDFLNILKSDEAKAFAQEIGASLSEAFTAVSNTIKGAITWFTALSPGMQSTVLTLAGIAVAAGPVLIVVGKIATGIGALISVGGTMVGITGGLIAGFRGTALAANASRGALIAQSIATKVAAGAQKVFNLVMRANPIGIVITLIAALVAGLVWFFTQTQIGQDIWAGFMGFLSDSWANITVIFQTSMAVISTLWTTMWTSISTFFSALWAGIVTVVQTTIATVQAVIATVVSAISIAWKAVWNGIKAVFSAIWAGIVFVVTTYINTVRTIITTVVNAIKAVWTTVWNAIKTVAVNVWNGIKSFITSAINSVRTTISNIVNAIRSLWSTVWNAIKSIASSVWNGIKSTVSNGINFVRSTISSVINGIRGIWNSVWSGISSFFSSVWSNIVSAASSFMGAVRERFSAVIDFVRGVPGKIIGFFTGMGSKLVASGKSLIQGFLDGIMAGFNKAKSFVSDGLGKIRNLFPFSPAKEGPFSGKGWVAYSGLSIGQTFSESVAGALHDGKKDIADEMGGIQGELDSLNEPTFRVGSAVPAFSDDPYGSDGSGAGARQIILQVENLTVDSDDRVTQLSQALWSRANNADRATGKVNLGGVTV
ncbi:phage tail protein [Glutamicibacter ardleyensis]|uniref:phage tail protein n=1 Tax=Glutamicibacter ardleyensis TaxID=225894 RepID=UPI003FD28364